MNPLVIYIGLLVFGIGLMVIASQAAGEPTRMCPECGGQVPIRARICRACKYRFSR